MRRTLGAVLCNCSFLRFNTVAVKIIEVKEMMKWLTSQKCFFSFSSCLECVFLLFSIHTNHLVNISPDLCFSSFSSSDSDAVEEKSVYGVEGNSTFLECVPWSPPAELRWTVQRHTGSSQQTEDRVSLNQSTSAGDVSEEKT